MLRQLTVVASSVVCLAVSPVSAEVPFQPLADFGFGGSPFDVNAAGLIVGAVNTKEPGTCVPVVWDAATATPVELPNEFGGYAVAINSNGDIAGIEFQEFGIYGTPVVWLGGERFELPDLGEGGYANDINESGVVVGSVISKGQYRAARWVDRELELLPLPEFEVDDGVIWSFANSINSSGVVTGTIQAPSGTPSAALRWDSEGVSLVPSDGLETKGVSIDNLGGVLINGYFDGGWSRAPAVVMPDGEVNVLPVPAGLFGGASGLSMSRNGIVAGYYYGSGPGGFQIKAVAWPNGVFTPLAMPEGQRYAFPSGVGVNGIVFGSATDGVSAVSVPGFWQLDVEDNLVETGSLVAGPGETVELSAVSRRTSGVNIGHSVAVTVDGNPVGQAITDAKGVARLAFTVPADFTGSQLTVQYVDENGAAATGVIDVETGCVPADLNCDGAVNPADLANLLANWGSPGPGDIDGNGAVGSGDLTALLAAWTG
jgi:hypothetical protein